MKKLDEMPVSCSVHAPRSKGCVTIDVGRCFKCMQADPSKISVIEDGEEIIETSMVTDTGHVFKLRCDECGHEYNIGVISVDSDTPSGSWTCQSMFLADIENGKPGTWKWLGIC